MDATNAMNTRKSREKPSRKKVTLKYSLRKKKRSSSLSLSLDMGSYKKRVRDLSYNNKALARELQTARCKIAEQRENIEANASEKNKIMLAQLKIKNFCGKVMTEIPELLGYFDFDCTCTEVEFHTKRGKKKRKVPPLKSIDEVSVPSESATSDAGANQLPGNSTAKQVTVNGATSKEIYEPSEESCSENYVPLPSDNLNRTFNVDESGNPEGHEKELFETSKKNPAMPNIVADDSAALLNPVLSSEIDQETAQNICLELKEGAESTSCEIRETLSEDAIHYASIEKELLLKDLEMNNSLDQETLSTVVEKDLESPVATKKGKVMKKTIGTGKAKLPKKKKEKDTKEEEKVPSTSAAESSDVVMVRKRKKYGEKSNYREPEMFDLPKRRKRNPPYIEPSLKTKLRRE